MPCDTARAQPAHITSALKPRQIQRLQSSVLTCTHDCRNGLHSTAPTVAVVQCFHPTKAGRLAGLTRQAAHSAQAGGYRSVLPGIRDAMQRNKALLWLTTLTPDHMQKSRSKAAMLVPADMRCLAAQRAPALSEGCVAAPPQT